MLRRRRPGSPIHSGWTLFLRVLYVSLPDSWTMPAGPPIFGCWEAGGYQSKRMKNNRWLMKSSFVCLAEADLNECRNEGEGYALTLYYFWGATKGRRLGLCGLHWLVLTMIASQFFQIRGMANNMTITVPTSPCWKHVSKRLHGVNVGGLEKPRCKSTNWSSHEGLVWRLNCGSTGPKWILYVSPRFSL